MDFRVPGFSVEMQHNHVYPTLSASPSSNYTNFSDKSMEGGPVDMREVIQRELEKEMIREKIIAEEVERFNVLEAEVRRELMMGREMMAIKSGKGLPSSFMFGPQPGEINETTTSLLKVGMGNLNLYGLTPPESKLKPPPPSFPAAGGSSELSYCSSKKMEWRCSICKISASSERGLLEHLAGKKHHVKAASIVIKNPPKCVNLKNKMEWRCPICEVSAPCERGLQDHLAGKKHQTKVAALKADTIEKAMKSVDNLSESVSTGSNENPKKPPPPHPSPSLPAVAGSSEPLKKKMEWRCPICKVSSSSEIDLQKHLAGKKHKAKVAIIRKGKNI